MYSVYHDTFRITYNGYYVDTSNLNDQSYRIFVWFLHSYTSKKERFTHTKFGQKSNSSITGGYLTARFIDCQNLYVLLKYTIHISSEITGGYLTAKFFDFGFFFQNLENW